MSKFRPIENVLQGPKPHWVGSAFRVSNYFPSGSNLLERFTPFILMDYNAPYNFEPSSTPRGVGAHPHRGFETVTIAYEGYVEHHDNTGEHGIIGPGDVQWMTASSGILHKEYLENNFNSSGGILHMIQLWVNLPKKNKLDPPKYQALLKENMGSFIIPDDGGNVSVIAGEFNGVKGPASTFSPINMYTIRLKNAGKLNLDEPSNFNTGILILNGNVKVNENTDCNEGDFILFENKEGNITIEAISENAMAIVLSGEPIDEPIATGGPFVMNTSEEIQLAYRDFREGKFGSLDF